ncbi:hypothetical protein V4S36_04470 [Enterococcus cecorum]|uniref:hypothetical protein n=1 Tax=Enterococcus cecorum TaxID=44008 RepID=UPI003265F657
MKLSMIEVFQLQAEGKINHGAKLLIMTEFAEYDYIYNKKEEMFFDRFERNLCEGFFTVNKNFLNHIAEFTNN